MVQQIVGWNGKKTTGRPEIRVSEAVCGELYRTSTNQEDLELRNSDTVMTSKNEPNLWHARLPMWITKQSPQALAAYLAAHDHSDNSIGWAVEMDEEEVRVLFKDFENTS